MDSTQNNPQINANKCKAHSLEALKYARLKANTNTTYASTRSKRPVPSISGTKSTVAWSSQSVQGTSGALFWQI
eukprot:3585882-Amphidinium_carterae.2